MAKLKPETAALVAAQLTLARATLVGGVLAGRTPNSAVNIEDKVVENLYLHYLAFASEVDPRSAEVGAMLDLTQSSILPS